MGEKLPLGEVLSFGWGAFKQRPGFWIGVAAILFGLTIVYQILSGIFAGVFGGSGLLLGVISLALLAAYVYAQTRLTVGTTFMALSTADGGAPGIESLLAKPHLLVRYFLAYMLFSIATGIGFLLLVIPGVYLLIRFGLFGFAMVDRETRLKSTLTRFVQEPPLGLLRPVRAACQDPVAPSVAIAAGGWYKRRHEPTFRASATSPSSPTSITASRPWPTG